MSPIHFDILEPIFRHHGYNFEVLQNDDRAAIDAGLKYVNNDACYPSITAVGQLMEAVTSGGTTPTTSPSSCRRPAAAAARAITSPSSAARSKSGP